MGAEKHREIGLVNARQSHTNLLGQPDRLRGLVFLIVSLLGGMAHQIPAAEERPGFKPLRYDEDYRFLADPSKRTDYLDPIKYIPFGPTKTTYLTLGGEIRERYEFFSHEESGGQPADSHGINHYLLQRILLHSDLHLGSHLRIFGQFVSGLEEGRIGGPRPDIDENVFDLHQGFLDVIVPFAEQNSLILRPGRQELRYGSGRLIDVRGPPNLQRSFDAARLLLRANDWAVDGFWSKPVRNRLGVFDDDPDPNRSLWGLYAVRPLSFLPDGHADLYYLGFENKAAEFDQGSGYEMRHTLGTRLWGSPLPWEYDVEILWQFGHFNSGQIQAWAFASDTHYNFSSLPLRPRAGLRLDITSGDLDPDSPDLQTYNPLFPTGAYFNLADPAGPQNFIHVHPLVDLHLSKTVTATADWGFFWRQSSDDALYRISGPPLRTGQLSPELYVGSAPAGTLKWTPSRHFELLASYVHFFAGPFFHDTPPDKDIDYFTTWVTYKF